MVLKSNKEYARFAHEAGWNNLGAGFVPYIDRFENLAPTTQSRLALGAGALRRLVVQECIDEIMTLKTRNDGEYRMRGSAVYRLQEMLRATGGKDDAN